MPKTMTPRQLEANRRNATKHGILSQAVLLRGQQARESPREYQALRAEYFTELAPVGPVEAMLGREWHEEKARLAASALPPASALDKILRYETTLERQLYRAMHQLERLQRRRQGEAVPDPVAMEVTSSC